MAQFATGEAQIYALVGRLLTRGARLELRVRDVFVAAFDGDAATAGQVHDLIGDFAARSAAVEALLARRPDRKAVWSALAGRISVRLAARSALLVSEVRRREEARSERACDVVHECDGYVLCCDGRVLQSSLTLDRELQQLERDLGELDAFRRSLSRGGLAGVLGVAS